MNGPKLLKVYKRRSEGRTEKGGRISLETLVGVEGRYKVGGERMGVAYAFWVRLFNCVLCRSLALGLKKNSLCNGSISQ